MGEKKNFSYIFQEIHATTILKMTKIVQQHLDMSSATFSCQ